MLFEQPNPYFFYEVVWRIVKIDVGDMNKLTLIKSIRIVRLDGKIMEIIDNITISSNHVIY